MTIQTIYPSALTCLWANLTRAKMGPLPPSTNALFSPHQKGQICPGTPYPLGS
jgi:hypothetical protein